MRNLDLFSDIGDFILVAHSLGIKTVQLMEINHYYRQIIAKNFPNIPIYLDIHNFNAQLNQYDLVANLDNSVSKMYINSEDHIVSKTYITRLEGENTRLRHYPAPD